MTVRGETLYFIILILFILVFILLFRWEKSTLTGFGLS